MRTLMIVTGMVLAAQIGTSLAVEAKPAAAGETEGVKADVSITITGNDTLQFDKKEFTVKEGQTIALHFKNVGKVPKAAMGHNLVVLKPGTQSMIFANASMAQKDTTGLPTDAKLLEAVVASTKVLGPDEEETVTFTAPAPGEYPYVCTFPGHAALMKGVMKVEAK